MTQMYSNARLSKPYSSPLKAPRSAVDESKSAPTAPRTSIVHNLLRDHSHPPTSPEV